MKKKAFMMNGYTACGKSTTARKIEKQIRSAGMEPRILQTNSIRNAREDRKEISMGSCYFTEDSHRDIIYGIMLDEMKKAIKEGRVPILDATYNKKKWRLPVYECCEDMSVGLYVVRCVCNDDAEIMKRISLRIANGDDPHFLELKDPSSVTKSELERFLDESYGIYKNIRKLAEDIDTEELEKHGFTLIEHDTIAGYARASNGKTYKSIDEAITDALDDCFLGRANSVQ